MRIQKPIVIRDRYLERIITELQALKAEEHRLIHLYPRLRHRPMLRVRFWMDLAGLRDRLNSWLDPLPQLQHGDAAQAVAAQREQLCA